MQKVIQRAKRVHRIAARRRTEEKKQETKRDGWQKRRTEREHNREIGANFRDARINRRVDWETGMLAPRRDVGEKAETYGTMSLRQLHPPDLHPTKAPKWSHLIEGDRVVLIRGRDKGKIGVVQTVAMDKAAVQVKGLNVVDVVIPDWLVQERQEDGYSQIMSPPRQILWEDVRLVYPLPHPVTGVPRDVIIDRLVRVNQEWDKARQELSRGDRLIPGTNTLIPWPEQAEEQFEDHDEDTLRIEVEEVSFRPYLLHPPMPVSVVDELRNKYSKFRTRHTWEYIQEKELEDERVEKRKELGKGMRTPLQELAAARKAQKEAQEKDMELSEEHLSRIGEVIARERERALGQVQQMGAAAPQ